MVAVLGPPCAIPPRNSNSDDNTNSKVHILRLAKCQVRDEAPNLGPRVW
jgi:hypothetical protein